MLTMRSCTRWPCDQPAPPHSGLCLEHDPAQQWRHAEDVAETRNWQPKPHTDHDTDRTSPTGSHALTTPPRRWTPGGRSRPVDAAAHAAGQAQDAA